MRLLHPITREENNESVKKHPFYCYKAQLQFVGWLKQHLRRTDFRGQPGPQVEKRRASWQSDKSQPRSRCILFSSSSSPSLSHCLVPWKLHGKRARARACRNFIMRHCNEIRIKQHLCHNHYRQHSIITFIWKICSIIFLYIHKSQGWSSPGKILMINTKKHLRYRWWRGCSKGSVLIGQMVQI